MAVGIIKFEKHFSKFYRRYNELISKFKIGLKSFLHLGLLEPEFYGDLGYKLKENVSRADFSDQFRKVIMHHKLIGNNTNVIVLLDPNKMSGRSYLCTCPQIILLSEKENRICTLLTHR